MALGTSVQISFQEFRELREGQPGEPRLQGFTGCLWLWVGVRWGRDGSRETGGRGCSDVQAERYRGGTSMGAGKGEMVGFWI